MTNKNCERYRSFNFINYETYHVSHTEAIFDNATRRSRDVLTKLSNRTWSWPIRELKIASLRNDGGGSNYVNISNNIIIKSNKQTNKQTNSLIRKQILQVHHTFKKAVRKLPLFPLPPSPRLLPLVFPIDLAQLHEQPTKNTLENLLKSRLLNTIAFEFRIINEIERF